VYNPGDPDRFRSPEILGLKQPKTRSLAAETVTQRMVIKARCSKLKSRRDPGIGEMQFRNPWIEKYQPGLYTLIVCMLQWLSHALCTQSYFNGD